MSYELLMTKLEKEGIELHESDRIGRLEGLYIDGIIVINPIHSTTNTKKKCLIAEELGHHYTTHGDILDQRNVANKKQELRARRWGYQRLVPIGKLIQAYQYGCRNRYEVAQYIEVTEEYIEGAITYYLQKYGICKQVGKYTVYFNPFGVMERR